jgi:hypothetical protein
MPSANAGIVTGEWTGDPQLVKTQLQLNYKANGTEARHSDWPRHREQTTPAIYGPHLGRCRTLRGRVMGQTDRKVCSVRSSQIAYCLLGRDCATLRSSIDTDVSERTCCLLLQGEGAAREKDTVTYVRKWGW